MERPKYIIALIFTLLIAINSNASNKSLIYNAYINNNMSQWKTVIDEMQNKSNKNRELIAELVNYQYGYIAWCLGNDKHPEAKLYLELSEENLDYLEQKNYNSSFVNAYKSAFYGYNIALNNLLAPFIGNKSLNSAQKAIQLDGKNPYGFIQYGNAQFYMPAIFGGSKTEAINYYKKAEVLMESHKLTIVDDWNYLNLLVNLAQSYQTLNNYDMAKYYCEKLMRIEPNFLWVKNELYPKILNEKTKN